MLIAHKRKKKPHKYRDIDIKTNGKEWHKERANTITIFERTGDIIREMIKYKESVIESIFCWKHLDIYANPLIQVYIKLT